VFGQFCPEFIDTFLAVYGYTVKRGSVQGVFLFGGTRNEASGLQVTPSTVLLYRGFLVKGLTLQGITGAGLLLYRIALL